MNSSAQRNFHGRAPVGRLILLAVAASLFFSGACTNRPASQEATPVLPGPPATTFPMPPLDASGQLGWVLDDGRRVTLADYRGKVLLLDFYATWCAPCRQSIPRLSRLRQDYGRDGVEVVGLNVGGPDDRIKVAEFAKELNIQYPLGFPDKALTDLFLSDNQTIPQTYVFARDGRLLKRFVGYNETTGNELDKLTAETVTSPDSRAK